MNLRITLERSDIERRSSSFSIASPSSLRSSNRRALSLLTEAPDDSSKALVHINSTPDRSKRRGSMDIIRTNSVRNSQRAFPKERIHSSNNLNSPPSGRSLLQSSPSPKNQLVVIDTHVFVCIENARLRIAAEFEQKLSCTNNEKFYTLVFTVALAPVTVASVLIEVVNGKAQRGTHVEVVLARDCGRRVSAPLGSTFDHVVVERASKRAMPIHMSFQVSNVLLNGIRKKNPALFVVVYRQASDLVWLPLLCTENSASPSNSTQQYEFQTSTKQFVGGRVMFCLYITRTRGHTLAGTVSLASKQLQSNGRQRYPLLLAMEQVGWLVLVTKRLASSCSVECLFKYKQSSLLQSGASAPK